jgi:hypothetical protein
LLTLRRTAQCLRQPSSTCACGRQAQAVVFNYSTQNFSPVAADVLFRALGLVGTPYRWGGNTPDSGFDCSGLIGFVYRDAAGISLPRTTRELIVMRAQDVREDASCRPATCCSSPRAVARRSAMPASTWVKAVLYTHRHGRYGQAG